MFSVEVGERVPSQVYIDKGITEKTIVLIVNMLLRTVPQINHVRLIAGRPR